MGPCNAGSLAQRDSRDVPTLRARCATRLAASRGRVGKQPSDRGLCGDLPPVRTPITQVRDCSFLRLNFNVLRTAAGFVAGRARWCERAGGPNELLFHTIPRGDRGCTVSNLAQPGLARTSTEGGSRRRVYLPASAFDVDGAARRRFTGTRYERVFGGVGKSSDRTVICQACQQSGHRMPSRIRPGSPSTGAARCGTPGAKPHSGQCSGDFSVSGSTLPVYGKRSSWTSHPCAQLHDKSAVPPAPAWLLGRCSRERVPERRCDDALPRDPEGSRPGAAPGRATPTGPLTVGSGSRNGGTTSHEDNHQRRQCHANHDGTEAAQAIREEDKHSAIALVA
jgi:hypothetical protein